ncbi:MAG TPA: glycosyltransferase family 4 protein [Gammaproteobacteria bacterium]|nr:glycosyltransferase family 4 protein [Gammaproteobacteria bacterium]
MAVSIDEIAVAADRPRPLRIMVLGLRGIAVQGGIESHARMLYPLLARLGCEIEVVQRGPYFPRGGRRRYWRGIKLTYLWSPTKPVLETAVHTLLGVLYAAVRRPDVLHLHAVGPGLLAPLARLFGLRVVLTHHGPDYEREKWGASAKVLLRAGERLGVRFAHRPIVVSPTLRDEVARRYGVGAELIPNGAPKVLPAVTRRSLERFGLASGRYVLCVGRLDPGKRQGDLIEAFRAAQLLGWKLVIVGGLSIGDRYCERIRACAALDPNVVLTDFQAGATLRELYSHAGLFVLPSAVEGHPIVLLEAATYGVPILASAIEANLALPLPRDRYFRVGDTRGLATLLRAAVSEPGAERERCDKLRSLVRTRYSWRRAAQLTRAVYGDAVGEALPRG